MSALYIYSGVRQTAAFQHGDELGPATELWRPLQASVVL